MVEKGLLQFEHLLSNSTVALFSDNSTALAYLRKQGGTRSTILNAISQRILRWAETIDLVLAPQFIQGKHNVLADSPSRPNQIQGSGWTLKWEVFHLLNKKWPVMIDLFATSLNHRCSLYFSPFHNPSAIDTDALLQNWDGYQVFAFPPWSMIPLILKKLHSSSGVLMTLVAPFWPPEAVVPGLSRPHGGRSDQSSCVSRSPKTTTFSLLSSRDPQAVPLCLETIQQFAKAKGFSTGVARQLGFARCSSSRAVYQAKWLVYRSWCRSENHSVSRPTLPKIADFLLWLTQVRKSSVLAVMGYRSMLSSVFRFKRPEISSSPVFQDLRSFKVETPRVVQPPSWDLNKVLNHLRSSTYEPLANLSLHSLTKKVLFLLSLATAKRVGELQALSWLVLFSSTGATVSCVLEFLTKTESALWPLPRSFLIKSLFGFCEGLR